MKNLLLYVLSAKQALDYKALYADMTENYVEPMEPEPNSMVRLRFRTAYKNVDSVKFISDDWRAEMKFSESVEDFSYYETEVWVGEEPLRYHFEVKVGRVIAAYDMTGVVKVSEVNHPFVLNPHVSTPDWSKGAVMYQIFTDRFFNGDVANDVTDREYHYISGYSKAMSPKLPLTLITTPSPKSSCTTISPGFILTLGLLDEDTNSLLNIPGL